MLRISCSRFVGAFFDKYAPLITTVEPLNGSSYSMRSGESLTFAIFGPLSKNFVYYLFESGKVKGKLVEPINGDTSKYSWNYVVGYLSDTFSSKYYLSLSVKRPFNISFS